MVKRLFTMWALTSGASMHGRLIRVCDSMYYAFWKEALVRLERLRLIGVFKINTRWSLNYFTIYRWSMLGRNNIEGMVNVKDGKMGTYGPTWILKDVTYCGTHHHLIQVGSKSIFLCELTNSYFMFWRP
jgi:hypothetical protein